MRRARLPVVFGIFLFVLGGALAQPREGEIRMAPSPATSVPGEYIAKLRPNALANRGAVESVLRRLQFAIVRDLPLISAILIRDVTGLKAFVQVESLLLAERDAAGQPLFEYVEPNYEWHVQQLTPNDPFYSQQWGLPRIVAPKAWVAKTDATTVVVAVIDTGVDYRHQDLAENMWRNPGETADGVDNDGNGIIDDIHGARFTGGASGDPADDHFHGTHVAGIIAGVGNNGLGGTGTVWRTRIIAVKFLRSNGSGSTSDAVLAIGYAIANGAHVINASWGGAGYSQALRDAIVAANQGGILFVAAAGNSGSNNDTSPSYPASYDVPNVMSVMATTRNDQRAPFSNYGARSVHLGAPGVGILSSLPGGYGSLSGTSMATPFVAGAAALLKALNPGWKAAELKSHLMATVAKIADLAGLSVTEGRLDLGVAAMPVSVTSPGAGAPWPIASRQRITWQAPNTLPGCSTMNLSLSVDDGASFGVSLLKDTPNDGAEDVDVPKAPSSRARVQVSCRGSLKGCVNK